jgi:glycosyltransferase involved in cell wall biosynthesis
MINQMISVIIPVYNAQDFIGRCLDSILANDFDDYEIIVINDGSKDDSLQILHEYRNQHPDKIRVYDQENQGVAKTRNSGIIYSKGEYIMFVDNDDYVDREYISTFVEEIEKNKFDIVIGGYKRVTSQKKLFEMRLKDAKWSRYMVMAPWAKVYKRSFLLEKKIEFLNSIGEDVYFNLQAINSTDDIFILDYCGYNWFYNEQSVSNTIKKTPSRKFDVIFLLDSCYFKLKDLGVIGKEDVEFYFVRYVIWYILFIGRNSNYGEIYTEFLLAFDWLNEKFPEFHKNKNISLIKPKGENFKNKVIVYAFMRIYGLKLTKYFLMAYSRGR